MSEKSFNTPLPNLNLQKTLTINDKIVPKTYPLARNLVIEIPVEEYGTENLNEVRREVNSDKCEDEQNDTMVKTVRNTSYHRRIVSSPTMID